MERTVYLQKIHVLWLISMGFLVAKYTSPIWMVWGKLVPVSTLVYLFCLRLNGCPKSLFSTPTLQLWAFFASPKFQYTLSLSGGFNGFILLYARFCGGKDAHF